VVCVCFFFFLFHFSETQDRKLRIAPHLFRETNFYKDVRIKIIFFFSPSLVFPLCWSLIENKGDVSTFSQVMENVSLGHTWFECRQNFNFDQKRKEADSFNATHHFKKRGLAIAPVRYGHCLYGHSSILRYTLLLTRFRYSIAPSSFAAFTKTSVLIHILPGIPLPFPFYSFIAPSTNKRRYCVMPSWRSGNGTGSTRQDSSGMQDEKQRFGLSNTIDMRTCLGSSFEQCVYPPSECRGATSRRDNRRFLNHRVGWPGNSSLQIPVINVSNCVLPIKAVVNACEQLLKRLEPLKNSEAMKGTP